jgi:hypothetical protein
MHKPLVSLIAAQPDETVPAGVPLTDAHLPALDTDEVKTWVSDHRGCEVFVVAGVNLAAGDTPALSLTLTEQEYLDVLAAMPH